MSENVSSPPKGQVPAPKRPKAKKAPLTGSRAPAPLPENSGAHLRGGGRNLRSWRKGQSGNPGGRPRKDPNEVARYQKRKAAGKAGPSKLYELAVLQEGIARMASEGEPPNLQLASQAAARAQEHHRDYTERFEGRPVQQTQISTPEDGVVIQLVRP